MEEIKYIIKKSNKLFIRYSKIKFEYIKKQFSHRAFTRHEQNLNISQVMKRQLSIYNQSDLISEKDIDEIESYQKDLCHLMKIYHKLINKSLKLKYYRLCGLNSANYENTNIFKTDPRYAITFYGFTSNNFFITKKKERIFSFIITKEIIDYYRIIWIFPLLFGIKNMKNFMSLKICEFLFGDYKKTFNTYFDQTIGDGLRLAYKRKPVHKRRHTYVSHCDPVSQYIPCGPVSCSYIKKPFFINKHNGNFFDTLSPYKIYRELISEVGSILEYFKRYDLHVKTKDLDIIKRIFDESRMW